MSGSYLCRINCARTTAKIDYFRINELQEVHHGGISAFIG